MVAAYSTEGIYIAQLSGDGQLQKSGQLPGVKAVHWCPGRAVLAVICQQADPLLLVLAEHQADRGPTPTFPLQRLPGPRTATSGARCATWLPASNSSGSSRHHDVAAALLVAWPADVLLYCWSNTAHGAVNWKHPRVHKFLTGWPGPARTLAAVPATHIYSSSSPTDSSSRSCIVVGAMDAQLSLETQDEHQLDQQQGPSRTSSCAVGSDSPVQLLTPGNQRAQSGGGGVLSRLMNLHHHAGINTAAGMNSSSSSSSSSHPPSALGSIDGGVNARGSACLCMLQINLTDYSTDGRRSSQSGMGPTDGLAATGKQFVTAVKLEHLPLPNILAVYGDVVAVASTKGLPVVTLCAVSSRVGLQLLQSVSIPLPAAAGPDVTNARLQGIVLAAQQQQQPGYAYEISSSGSDLSSSSSLFPGVDLAGGGSVSALLSAPRSSVDKANQHHPQQQQLLPNVVALVTCSTDQPETGHFASFDNNTGAAAAAGDTYLMTCRVAPLAAAQQRQQDEISAYLPASPRQQQQVRAPEVIQHQSGTSSDASPKQQQQPGQVAVAVLSPREHAAAPSPRQQSPMASPRPQSPMVSPRPQAPTVSPRPQSPMVSPRHQSLLVSPRQQLLSASPVSPRQQRASCNGVAYTVLPKAAAGQLASSPASPRQHTTVQSQQQQQKRGSDGGSCSSSYASTVSSPRSAVVHRCPWLRNMQLKEDEEEQQRLQEAAAAKAAAAAAAKGSSNALIQQQQQQLDALQQQMHCFLQQHSADSRQSGNRLDKLVKCVTAVQATLQQQGGSREYLDATVTALGRLQSTMECILAALQQQQQRAMSEAVAAPEAAAMVNMLQHTMESLLQSMQEQQLLLQDSMRAPVAAAVGAAEGIAATESYGRMQATLDDMLQLMQQQHHRVSPAGPAEGLETSSAVALDRMQSTLELVLQALQQQQQQQFGTVSPSAAAATDSPDLAVAFSKMQSTMEGVLTTLQQQQQQQQQALLMAREPAPAAVTAAAFGTLQASIERLTDTLEQHQKQQQAAIQDAQKQQAAVAAAAVANLQVSLESRLDSMLQQQQLLLEEARQKDHVVVGAMAQLQCGIERKLDAMHHTLKDMVVKLAGLEEELAELEQ